MFVTKRMTVHFVPKGKKQVKGTSLKACHSGISASGDTSGDKLSGNLDRNLTGGYKPGTIVTYHFPISYSLGTAYAR